MIRTTQVNRVFEVTYPLLRLLATKTANTCRRSISRSLGNPIQRLPHPNCESHLFQEVHYVRCSWSKRQHGAHSCQESSCPAEESSRRRQKRGASAAFRSARCGGIYRRCPRRFCPHQGLAASRFRLRHDSTQHHHQRSPELSGTRHRQHRDRCEKLGSQKCGCTQQHRSR